MPNMAPFNRSPRSEDIIIVDDDEDDCLIIGEALDNILYPEKITRSDRNLGTAHDSLNPFSERARLSSLANRYYLRPHSPSSTPGSTPSTTASFKRKRSSDMSQLMSSRKSSSSSQGLEATTVNSNKRRKVTEWFGRSSDTESPPTSSGALSGDSSSRDTSPDTLRGSSPDDDDVVEDLRQIDTMSIASDPEDTEDFTSGFSPEDYLRDDEIAAMFRPAATPVYPTSRPRSAGNQKGRRLRASGRQLRNEPVLHPWVENTHCFYDNNSFSPGNNVELADGSFVRITKILRNVHSNQVRIRGWVFKRTSNDATPLDASCNEVYWVNDMDQDDGRRFQEQCVEEFPVEEVVRRRTIKLTNTPRLENEVRSGRNLEQQSDFDRDNGSLCCRVRALRRWKTAVDRNKNGYCEEAFIHLRSSEADAPSRSSDDVTRRKFRGESVPGGAGLGMCKSEKEKRDYEAKLRVEAKKRREAEKNPIYLNEETVKPYSNLDPIVIPDDDSDSEGGENEEMAERPQDFLTAGGNRPDPLWHATRLASEKRCITHSPQQRYTFGDAFAGCGGMSRGATMAGLEIVWALDFDAKACESYRQSYPWVRVANCDAFNFATHPSYWIKVDVLHLSPPCQFFSPAHTSAGKNDERNVASSFVISELLKATKPRIVTLENTFGLQNRHPEYMKAIVNQFTSVGYSVRYMILHLRDYGVPSIRRRLIFIASCPGEPLPEFPEFTHSLLPAETGLKRYQLIHDAINGVPRTWQFHNPQNTTTKKYPTYSPYSLAKTITTSGVEQGHPSGERKFTPRELACIQGFPLEHEFADGLKVGTVIRQIGNSVPPTFAQALYSSIIKSLRKTDGFHDAEPGTSASAPLDIDGPTPIGYHAAQTNVATRSAPGTSSKGFQSISSSLSLSSSSRAPKSRQPTQSTPDLRAQSSQTSANTRSFPSSTKTKPHKSMTVREPRGMGPEIIFGAGRLRLPVRKRRQEYHEIDDDKIIIVDDD